MRRELRVKPSGYVHTIGTVSVGPNNASVIVFVCGLQATGFNTAAAFPLNAKRCTTCWPEWQPTEVPA